MRSANWRQKRSYDASLESRICEDEPVDPAFVGIDVAIAKGKHLPVAICTWEEEKLIPKRLRSIRLEPPRGFGNAAAIDPDSIRRFARESVRYVSDACRHLQLSPTRIGIDAPSAPRCTAVPRRKAEFALDRARISCFATPSVEDFEIIRAKVRRHIAAGGREDRIPHANQLWMLAGFELFRELSLLAPCLEVFPQATIRAVGLGQMHKSRPGAVEDQLQAVTRQTGWAVGSHGEPALHEISWGEPHDQLDAYLSAWVASLEAPDRVCYGLPPDDAIWVPRLAEAPLQPLETRQPLNMRPRRSAAESQQPRRQRRWSSVGMRPKGIKRWPWGWDAHAAHICKGLSANSEEERKAEFRRLVAEFFRR